MTNSVFVKRNISIRPSCSKKQIELTLENLGAISGVKSTLFSHHEYRISIEYDLIKVSYTKLESLLIDRDVYHKSGVWKHLVSAWYEYLDTTGRDNALAPPAACCNKPPRRF